MSTEKKSGKKSSEQVRMLATTPAFRRWKSAVILTAALCLAAVTLFTRDAGATATMHVDGHFTFDNDTPLACPPAAALCFTGNFTGGIQGRFDNTITRLTPSAVPGVSYFSGNIVIRYAALFAADATLEDPVGTRPSQGRDAIRQTYSTAPLAFDEVNMLQTDVYAPTLTNEAAVRWAATLRVRGTGSSSTT
jgi:hypothetical protein